MSDDEVCQVVGDRIVEVMASEGEMVTKWLAIVEIVDSDGHRWIRTLTNDDAKSWDNLGMLTFAVQQEQAAAARDD